MTKFNKPNTAEQKIENEPTKTTNYEGGVAFEMTPEIELYTRVATEMVGESKFYDPKGADTQKAILELVGKVAQSNPEFVLQLAAYARNELYLRSVPLMLLVEACRYPETKKMVRAYTPSIIQRADELAEVTALWIARNGPIGDGAKKGMMCNPLRRGLADAFGQFNEYSFAKYDREGAVKLKDVLRIVHPKPKNPEQAALYARVRDRTLKTPDTWEVAISTNGSKKETWEAILPKMPFMARLRNLRNLLEHEVDVESVVEMLRDEKAVAGSKQFPYRFLSAYKVVAGIEANPQVRKVLSALEKAIDLSVVNVPHWPGTTLVATDSSGSMDTAVSEKSGVTRAQIGFVLGAMANKISDNAYAGAFGDNWQTVALNPDDGILRNEARLEGLDVGHSTNAWEVVKWMREKKVKVDRLVLFSDMQCYDSKSGRAPRWGMGHNGAQFESLAKQVEEYRREVNHNLFVYSFDLLGYGTTQFVESDSHTALLAGWSDKVLGLVPLFEEKKSIAEKISEIRAVTYRRKQKDEEEDSA